MEKALTATPLLRDLVEIDTRTCEYRLSKSKTGSDEVSFSMTVAFDGESETLSFFTHHPLTAEAFYLLAIRETVLPNTLGDVWRDFHN